MLTVKNGVLPTYIIDVRVYVMLTENISRHKLTLVDEVK